MDVANLLANTLSPDQALRVDATQQLENFANGNYPEFVLSLSQLLANEQTDVNIRMSAGLALKNSLSSKEKESQRKEMQRQRWLAVDENTRTQVKKNALEALGSLQKRAGDVAGQVVSAVAEIELPSGQWLDLFYALKSFTETDNVNLRQASLQAIGYVCEVTDPSLLASQSSLILTVIVTGIRDKAHPEVMLAAVRALYNSLEFIRDNFEREGERNVIMQEICEATQSESDEVQVVAFECIAQIMFLYYDKMANYMTQALFPLTMACMAHENEKIALQAIEFWSTVCDVEIEIIETQRRDGIPEHQSYYFAASALEHILPILLDLLTKQEEDEDEEEWNVSMASATCISLLSQCVQNQIVGPIKSFIEANIQNGNWKYRDAAVMAFGSILDGPSEEVLKPLVEQALPILITMLRDPIVNVKDTVAWTLGRICELHIQSVLPEIHKDLITTLVYGLQDNPRIVGNCCWALMNLAEQLGPELGSTLPSYPLSPYFDGIVSAFLDFTKRSDNEANCRTSAYEAISTFVMYAAEDCMPSVEKAALETLSRLEVNLQNQNQIIGVDQITDHFELQSCILGVITSCIHILEGRVLAISDRIMTDVFQLLSLANRQTTTTEDAFMLVSAMATSLGPDFERYVQPFVPFLCEALENPSQGQLCTIAVGVLGDICRAVKESSIPYCEKFMELLISNLRNPELDGKAKPNIISCLGDIAEAIGDKFEPFLDVSMADVILQAASMTVTNPENYELVEYVERLQESTIEACVGIRLAFKDSPKVGLLVKYMPELFQKFGVLVASFPHRSDKLTFDLIGLIGDYAESFGPQIRELLMQEWIKELVKEGRFRPGGSKESVRRTQVLIKRACK